VSEDGFYYVGVGFVVCEAVVECVLESRFGCPGCFEFSDGFCEFGFAMGFFEFCGESFNCFYSDVFCSLDFERFNFFDRLVKSIFWHGFAGLILDCAKYAYGLFALLIV